MCSGISSRLASHLSFAVRAPSHNDKELENLDLLARDVVSSYNRVVLSVHFAESRQ